MAEPTRVTEHATEFSAYVGRTGPPTLARHPVNEPMIAHWCDAMGDLNPIYTDAEFAAASVHAGIVAPPAMLDVWDRPGLLPTGDPRSPRTQVMQSLFAQGFDSIVAVNTELELPRYVRPGELLANIEILESVSVEKRTSRGPGYFVTTRHRYTNQHGESVGELLFRILLFRSEAQDPTLTQHQATAADLPADAPAAVPAPTAPSSDPALRPVPAINADNEFFWDGARRHELRIQRCEGCGRLLMPPGPRCPSCGSFEMGWTLASGHGRLYSFAVSEYPKVEGYSYPLCIALVELEEGTRIVANLAGLDAGQLAIGMPLELCWLERAAGGLPLTQFGALPQFGALTQFGAFTQFGALPQFRAPDPIRAVETLALSDLSVGDRLPLCSLAITTTLVVAGAIATRDYTAVHHDRTVAEREGSTDVFLNINTSVGLLQRVISDWAGPEAVFGSLKVRLGAPGYPGDVLTFSGEVSSIDPARGVATLALKASGPLGDHAVATVELSFPAGRAS